MGSNTISNDEAPPTEALTFQVIELESSVGTFDYAPNAKCSVIELFGRTDDNISVLVHVHCSFPYFYAEICSRNELSTKFAEDVKAKIHEKLETLFSIKYPFMVDNGVCGCCWIQLKPGSFRTRREEWKRVSTCQLECDVIVSSLIVYSLE
ncbi:hypothetical protein B4U79_19257, partial [Dinothrombium tinctorium]